MTVLDTRETHQNEEILHNVCSSHAKFIMHLILFFYCNQVVNQILLLSIKYYTNIVNENRHDVIHIVLVGRGQTADYLLSLLKADGEARY